MYSPWDFPDKYPTALEIKEKYFECEDKIYDNICCSDIRINHDSIK